MRARWPRDVREVLTAAGWRPGRHVAAQVSTWLWQVYDLHPGAADRLPVHPVARRLLDEFGGLTFRRPERVGSGSGGFDVELWPTSGRVLVDLFAEFGADLGAPVFPLAVYQDGPSDIVCAADGRVFLLRMAGKFLVGPNPDQAIVRLVRGETFIPVDDRGEPY